MTAMRYEGIRGGNREKEEGMTFGVCGGRVGKAGGGWLVVVVEVDGVYC